MRTGFLNIQALYHHFVSILEDRPTTIRSLSMNDVVGSVSYLGWTYLLDHFIPILFYRRKKAFFRMIRTV